MENIKVEYLFPTQIVVSKIENFDNIKGELIDWVYDYKEKNPSIERISNKNGWQSLSKEVFLDKGFDQFKESIVNLISKMVLEYKINATIKLVQMWININGPNSYNVSHRHPGCDLSGCLWIKCPPESGRFVFDNMDTGYRDYKLYSFTQLEHLDQKKMQLEYVPTYEDGSMIIFPSSTTHRVEINETDEDRISLGFNLFIEGQMYNN